MGIFEYLRAIVPAADAGKSKADSFEQDASHLIDKGNALEAESRINEAMHLYLEAIRLAPNLARAHFNHGNALLATGDIKGALDAYGIATKLKADYAEAYYKIGNAQSDNWQFDDAVASYRRALKINPDLFEANYNLGVALLQIGQFEEAVVSFRRTLEIKPGMFEAHFNLGSVLNELGQMEKAMVCFRHTLEINPDFADAHFNLGVAFKEFGEIEKAMACFRRALEINPGFTDAHSILLLSLNYSTSLTSSYYLEQARQYGRIVAGKVDARFSDWQCVVRTERLRVGLVSGDFREHSVGHFLEGLLAHIDPSCIELIAYTTHHSEDKLTARIRPYFSAWKSLFDKNDVEAARLIHADGVHVLLDISGHTGYNRLPIFAWKPAPVQVTWLGLPSTTGLAEIDYVLV